MKKILFVCLGNICRSPAAEGMMRHLVRESGLENEIEIDSAGTIDEHLGELPDRRMRTAAKRRGLSLESRARPITREDLETFDWILTMDESNLRNVQAIDSREEIQEKIIPFCRFLTRHTETAVPDPYYGGPDGFEKVLDLLEDGCGELLRQLRAKENST